MQERDEPRTIWQIRSDLEIDADRVDWRVIDVVADFRLLALPYHNSIYATGHVQLYEHFWIVCPCGVHIISPQQNF